jgi:ATP-binding cassette, subfamily B, bacterial
VVTAREHWRHILARLHVAREQFHHVPRIVRLVRDASGKYFVLWFALVLLQGTFPAAIIYLSKVLVDRITEAVAGRVSAADALPGLVWVGGSILLILALTELSRFATDWLRTLQARLIEAKISASILKKSAEIDLAFYESSDSYDHLHRARDEASHRPVALVENVGAVAQSVVSLVSMAALIVALGGWMVFALLIATLPPLFLAIEFAARQHAWRRNSTREQRRIWYYEWLLTFRDNAAELRMYGASERFRRDAAALRDGLRGGELRLLGRQYRYEFCANVFALLVAAACGFWMLQRVLSRELSLGDLVLFYGAFSQAQRLMRALLSSVGQIYYNMLFLSDLFAFLDLPRQIHDPVSPQLLASTNNAVKPLSVSFNRVSFRYPNSDTNALNELTLHVSAGKTVAIVGANGAGKSTLTKLLCRFYDPDEGSIEIAGRDLRTLAMHDLRGTLGVLFQEPVHYSASVDENISIAAAGDASADAIKRAAVAAGADAFVTALPNGYASALGRWFGDGAELSVGQWQRIALARAYLRDAPIIVLDEPTSAMDSWAEIDWLARFRSLSSGRTAIIITHRLSTAMQADEIFVLDEGRVVESGSHQSLLAQGGRYATSWHEQLRDRAQP